MKEKSEPHAPTFCNSASNSPTQHNLGDSLAVMGISAVKGDSDSGGSDRIGEHKM